MIFKPVQDMGFSNVASQKLGAAPQYFLTSLLPFFHTAENCQGHIYYQPQIIELEKRPLLKEINFSGQILIQLKL